MHGKGTFDGDTVKLENSFTCAKIIYCLSRQKLVKLVTAVCGGGAVRDLISVL